MSFYKYLFFRIYNWNFYMWREEKPAVINTVMALVYMEVCLLNIVCQLNNQFSRFKILSPFDNYFSALLTVGILYFLNFSIFEKKKKYKEIIETFSIQKVNDKFWFFKGVLLFLVISSIMLIYILYPSLFLH